MENLRIFTDENRLKQIILNLISNSVKFTFSGIILIKADFNDLNDIEISVIDTGFGIKSEEHNLIFKENTQLNLDKEYNIQGSGLGLSITKNLAKSLNYNIGFESAYGEGSRFYVQIKNNESNFQESLNPLILTFLEILPLKRLMIVLV